MKASPVLLDIGCGTGIPLTKQLVKSGFQVIGVDISTEMIEKARRNVHEATFITGDIVSLVINRKFDGVLAWDSLFHLPLENQEKTIRRIIKMLNNDGILMFTTGGQAGELVSSMFDTEFYYSSLSVDHITSASWLKNVRFYSMKLMIQGVKGIE
jgi:2-polyprenyl-3-methyl-5-hydroxy-6-metoxy-1,4-benzoquinol methylase